VALLTQLLMDAETEHVRQSVQLIPFLVWTISPSSSTQQTPLNIHNYLSTHRGQRLTLNGSIESAPESILHFI
jgi:hypothetical protein